MSSAHQLQGGAVWLSIQSEPTVRAGLRVGRRRRTVLASPSTLGEIWLDVGGVGLQVEAEGRLANRLRTVWTFVSSFFSEHFKDVRSA